MALDGGSQRVPRQAGEPALLRSVGQLLIAMADEQISIPPPIPEHAPDPPPPPPQPRPRDDVELLLAEARQRAHRLIEDSVVRANELLRHDEGRGDWRLLERMRRSVNELGTEVRDIKDRLRRIEELLLAQAAYPAKEAPSEAPPPAEAPATEVTETEAAAEETTAEPEVERPESPLPMIESTEQMPEQTTEEREAPSAEAADAVAENDQPSDEPQPSILEPPDESPVELSEDAKPAQAAAAVATSDNDPRNGASAAEQVRFSPEQGSVVLRVAPVAGFHGLMRVQDALAEVAGVREAGVEAYAQGEARLRVRLADPIEAGRLADALSDRLGVPAHVLAASAEDRSVRLRFD
jgi:hypothetical protein